jgi:hypothetical protein
MVKMAMPRFRNITGVSPVANASGSFLVFHPSLTLPALFRFAARWRGSANVIPSVAHASGSFCGVVDASGSFSVRRPLARIG